MRTRDQSASSSSAMISGSDVIEPWPISVAADMMVIVPSVAMLIHGLSTLPLRSLPSTAACAPRSANANERPAAPIMIWRRDGALSKCRMGLFMSGLPRRAFDRAHDALVGPAAADVGAHMRDDLAARRRWIGLEQIGRAHDLAGLAVAALRHALGNPGLLQRMAGIRGQALDRRHRLAGDLRDLRLAGKR